MCYDLPRFLGVPERGLLARLVVSCRLICFRPSSSFFRLIAKVAYPPLGCLCLVEALQYGRRVGSRYWQVDAKPLCAILSQLRNHLPIRKLRPKGDPAPLLLDAQRVSVLKERGNLP